MIEKALGLFHLVLFGSLLVSLERIFTSLTDSVFNKASNLYFEWQWQNLFLFADVIKFAFLEIQAFTINGGGGVCGRACFYHHALVACFK